MTVKSHRFLVLHSSNEKARQLRDSLLARGDFEVACIDSAMDGIPYFQSLLPDTVILEAGIPHIPADVLVAAFRKLAPDFRLWIWVGRSYSGGLKREAAALKAAGILQWPFKEEDYRRITHFDGELPSLDSHLEQTVVEHSARDKTLSSGREKLIAAEDIHPGQSIRHHGRLRIVGDLREAALVETSHGLVIEGDVVASHIRCEGPLTVLGRVFSCDTGVFCRSHMDVQAIERSVVVCGRNLFLDLACRDSIVVVLHRLFGKSEGTLVSGGHLRVGERIEIGMLGDESHNETLVELAPDFLQSSWIASKRRFWDLAVAQNPRLGIEKGALFNSQLDESDFYRQRAELHATRISPGITIRIGEHEDYLFETRKNPVRITLGPKNGARNGIRIEEEQSILSPTNFKIL